MQHISIIARAFSEAVAIERSIDGDIRWLLAQFSDWLHIALLLCFHGDKQVCAVDFAI